MTQETLKLVNGNNREYTIGLPRLLMLGFCNNVAIEHIAENTGLRFTKTGEFGNWTVQPTTSKQIVKLFLTYNFKTQYYNNATWHNVLMLKSDHHVGFKVDSICFDCCKENNISIGGLKQGSRLSC